MNSIPLHYLFTAGFFAITGVLCLVGSVVQLRKSPWKTKSKEERWQIICLTAWVLLSAMVVFVVVSGRTGYIYPRYFENI